MGNVDLSILIELIQKTLSVYAELGEFHGASALLCEEV